MTVRYLLTACAVLVWASTAALSQRDNRAERLVLDDNNGNSIIVQTPAGPITGGTLTIPDPGGTGFFLISDPPGGSQDVNGDLLPGTDNTYDLGSGANRWQDLFTSGSVQVGGQLRLVETGGGTGYVGFQAPSAVTSNQVWTLPASDGSANEVLGTNGSGQLQWYTNAFLNVSKVIVDSLHFGSVSSNSTNTINVFVDSVPLGSAVFVTPSDSTMEEANAFTNNSRFDAWVSSPDTVTVRFQNGNPSTTLSKQPFTIFIQ